MTKERESLKVVWNEVNEQLWQELLRGCGQSNLLQTWAYGEAKRKSEGWKISRGVFYQSEKPIALVQILEKRCFPGARLVRVNRGPLFIGSVEEKTVQEVFRQLAKEFRLWRFSPILLAPELERTEQNLSLLKSAGFHLLKRGGTHSSRLDLTRSEDELRKALKGKWRNMVSFAERAGVKAEVETSNEAFEWLMSGYSEFMKEKSFVGPPVSLLRAWRDSLTDPNSLLVLRAMHEGRSVAGILLACHGVGATYLIGVTPAEGRQVKASNFLLWNAVVELKRRGFRFFDLGGLDEQRTPQITEFKRGMNGSEYHLSLDCWR
jgi:lipid II:glycine glycyltransferase (peptidoglycan interpeptide bridge formation enzyme)